MVHRDNRPRADLQRETLAAEMFPLDMSPDEYAARNAHLWGSFSFDDYRYRDSKLDAWIERLGDILFRRTGAPDLEELRARYLSTEERERIANEEAEF